MAALLVLFTTEGLEDTEGTSILKVLVLALPPSEQRLYLENNKKLLSLMLVARVREPYMESKSSVPSKPSVVNFYPWPSPAFAMVSSGGLEAGDSSASLTIRRCSAACAAG
jgi:hypothetical protein